MGAEPVLPPEVGGRGRLPDALSHARRPRAVPRRHQGESSAPRRLAHPPFRRLPLRAGGRGRPHPRHQRHDRPAHGVRDRGGRLDPDRRGARPDPVGHRHPPRRPRADLLVLQPVHGLVGRARGERARRRDDVPFGAGVQGQTLAAVQWAREIRPSAFYGTPSYALHFAETARREGLDPRSFGFRILFFSGEPGAGIASTKRLIEETFGGICIDSGSMAEMSPVDDERGVPTHGRACISGRTSSTRKFAIRGTYRRVPYGSEGHAGLHAPRAHVPADDPPRFRRPDALDGRAVPVRANLPAPAVRHLRALRRHAGRAGENVYPSGIEDALRAVPGFGGEFRVIVSRREAMDELASAPSTRLSTSRAGPARGAPARRCGTGCALGSGSTPWCELVPQARSRGTEFKARRVVDDRDLYRQALADRAGPPDDGSARRSGRRVSRRTSRGVLVRRARTAPTGRGAAETSVEEASMSSESSTPTSPSPIGTAPARRQRRGAHRASGSRPDATARDPDPSWIESRAPFRDAVRQLDAYFAGHAPAVRPGARPQKAHRSSSACGRRCSGFRYGETVLVRRDWPDGSSGPPPSGPSVPPTARIRCRSSFRVTGSSAATGGWSATAVASRSSRRCSRLERRVSGGLRGTGARRARACVFG